MLRATSWGQPWRTRSIARCRSTSARAASLAAASGSKPARLSSSARHAWTRSNSVSSWRPVSAVVIRASFRRSGLSPCSVERRSRLSPYRVNSRFNGLLTHRAGDPERLGLRELALEPERDAAVRPHEHVPGEANDARLAVPPRVEVVDDVLRAVDPERVRTVHNRRLDACGRRGELLGESEVAAELTEDDRLPGGAAEVGGNDAVARVEAPGRAWRQEYLEAGSPGGTV